MSLPERVTERARILMIMHIPPPVHGASIVGKYITEDIQLAEEFDVDIVNLSISTNLVEVGKFGPDKVWRFVKIQTKLISLLRRNRYQLCYVTLAAGGWGGFKDMLIITALKIRGIKILYHLHNKGFQASDGEQVKKSLYEFVFRKTSVILLSRYLLYDIEQYVSSSTLFFCPNGVPDLAPLHRNTIPGSPCKLLFLGNMIAAKGVFTLLNACKILKEKGHAFECHFVGGWSDITSGEFEDFISKNELDSVVFADGPKYGVDKELALSQSDVFVFPTHYKAEAFPLVLLEAMRAGLPVVTCNQGGIAEMVLEGVTGFMVPAEQPKELAQKIEILINNAELRSSMGIKARERFEFHYTLDKFGANFKAILREVLNKR